MDKNEDIIRLLPKRKKGLLRIVFSRFFVMSLLILLQTAGKYFYYKHLNFPQEEDPALYE